MPELNLYKNNREILRIPLSASGIKIGRSSQNDVILPEDEISRFHVSIEFIEGAYHLLDNSTSGTRIGTELVRDRKLNNGDEIFIGPYKMKYVQEGISDHQRDASVQTVLREEPSETTRILSIQNTHLAQIEEMQLEVTDLKKQTSRVKLGKLPFRMGSAAENQLILNDDYVSSRHCEITKDPNGYLLTDLNSTNGTYLNGRKISEVILSRGDEIRLGETLIKMVSIKKEESIKPLGQTFFCGMVAQTGEMQLLFSKLKKVAPTDLTVLIQAESGCGKELAARALHDLSDISKGPYVIINCGAISKELIESELFGHEKGSFTGALARRIGAFEQAHNGTLFLDEIGELPLNLQPKLLRVLENKTIKRVGGDFDIKVNVRVVAATHRNLSKMVDEGIFREDLFYRLHVIALGIPPLRERKEDIALLSAHFLRLSDPNGLARISGEALQKLTDHDWPGNVRELRNVLLKALVFSNGEIKPSEIEFLSVGNKKPEALVGEELLDLSDVEKQKILEAIKMAGGQKKKAAELLGIARSTLFKKLKDYGLDG